MVYKSVIVFFVFLIFSYDSVSQRDSLSYLLKSFSMYEYQINGKKVPKKDFYYSLSKNKTLENEFQSGKSMNYTGNIITYIGGFLVGWNIGDLMFKKNEKNYTLGMIGLGALAVGIPIAWVGQKKSDKALVSFNSIDLPNVIAVSPTKISVYDKDELDAEIVSNYKEIIDSSCIIIRIPVNGNKINLLSQKLKDKNTSPSYKSKLKKELDKTLMENKEYLSLIQTSFDLHFHVKQIYFLPDSSFKSHLAGNLTGFLNDEGVLDQSMQCHGKENFYFITGKDKEQLLFVNKYLEKPSIPFPHKKNTFLPAFKKIFDKQKYIDKQIIYFNEKLSQL